MTIYEIDEIFGRAFYKTAFYKTAINGFRATGLFPTDRDFFQEADFLIDSKNKEKTPEALKPVKIRVHDGLSSIYPLIEFTDEISTPKTSPKLIAASQAITEVRQSIIEIAADFMGSMPTPVKPQS